MKNLRKKIEGMTDSYWNIIDFEDRKQLNTEIEALIMPLVEALKIADEHLAKSIEEAGGCPYDNCYKHDDGTVSCLYEDCIHWKACEAVTKALKENRVT